VIINTGGGMAGGDRLAIDIAAEAGSHVVLSTPAAERVYGSTGLRTEVSVSLELAGGARLAWLPRETILFSQARLQRRLTVDMPANATLVLAEMTIFGRIAMGEEVTEGSFADRWRIRRDGRLLHAEDVRLEGQVSHLLRRPAIAKGARAMAAAILVSPQAEDKLDAVRAVLEGSPCGSGASAFDGMLVGRFLAVDPADLREAMVRFLLAAAGNGLPHSWTGHEDAFSETSRGIVAASRRAMRDWRLTRESELEPDPA
jgi:urease accessory protein